MGDLTKSGSNGAIAAHEAIRLEGRAVGHLCDPQSGLKVGLLYEWNTGEQQRAWYKAPLPRAIVVFDSGIFPSNDAAQGK